jgi:phosphatidylglycerophosphatase A
MGAGAGEASQNDTGKRRSGLQPKAPRWAWVAATFFGAGKMKPGPGTWGSLAALAIWRTAGPRIVPGWQPIAAATLAAAAMVVGIPAGTRVARELGAEDPSCVVIDEVAGQMIAYIGAPLNWKTLVAGFILFRLFDITKPEPCRWLEKLPEGTGIMMDDVGAGLYAFAGVQLLLRLGWLR